jgi:hypothetical protein
MTTTRIPRRNLLHLSLALIAMAVLGFLFGAGLCVRL